MSHLETKNKTLNEIIEEANSENNELLKKLQDMQTQILNSKLKENDFEMILE